MSRKLYFETKLANYYNSFIKQCHINKTMNYVITNQYYNINTNSTAVLKYYGDVMMWCPDQGDDSVIK